MQQNLGDIILSLPLHKIFTLGFYLMAAVYIIFTIIMYYHWNEYGIDEAVTKTTLITYLVTTVPLIIILGLMTFFI